MWDLLVMNGVSMGHILEIRIRYTLKIVIIMRRMGRFPSVIVRTMVFEVPMTFLRIILRSNFNRQCR